MMTIEMLGKKCVMALNRAAKWRSVFAGWQLGTRVDFDPECKAIRDHRECTIMHRIEISAITGLLLKKGIITEAEWYQAQIDEAEQYNKNQEERFKGMKATDDGMTMTTGPELSATLKGWRP